MATDDRDRMQTGILGDINPTPAAKDKWEERGKSSSSAGGDEDLEQDQSMAGGSQHDRTRHSGSRDVTEGATGGTGAEPGGTRNYRQGTGATGTDIGNRPE